MGILDYFCSQGYFPSVYVTRTPRMRSARQGIRQLRRSVFMQRRGRHFKQCGIGPHGAGKTAGAGLSSLRLHQRLCPEPGDPGDPREAAEVALTAGERQVDVGRFGTDRYFVYIAAFGAFTEVSYKTPQDKKNVLGHQAYILESVKSLGLFKIPSYEDPVGGGDH